MSSFGRFRLPSLLSITTTQGGGIVLQTRLLLTSDGSIDKMKVQASEQTFPTKITQNANNTIHCPRN